MMHMHDFIKKEKIRVHVMERQNESKAEGQGEISLIFMCAITNSLNIFMC